MGRQMYPCNCVIPEDDAFFALPLVELLAGPQFEVAAANPVRPWAPHQPGKARRDVLYVQHPSIPSSAVHVPALLNGSRTCILGLRTDR